MSELNTHELTLTWNGRKWVTSALPPGKAISVGFKAELTVPENALSDVGNESSPRLLFPKGTILYLPMVPTKDKISLRQRCALHIPRLTHRLKNKDLLPIILDSDLQIDPVNEQLEGCPCRFAGDTSSSFKSLNEAAKNALKTWTSRETGAIGVFMEVRFVHDSQLLQIDAKRDEVLHEQPLPDNPDRDDTPDLFEIAGS